MTHLWLSNIPVQHEMIKCCYYREFAFLNPNIRGLRLYKIEQLPKHLKLVNYEKHHPNMYVSVARLEYIPMFTYNPKERSKETNPWFQKEYHKYVSSYDLFMDFDKKEDESWNVLLDEINDFKSFLDEYQVPYYVLFSGSKGFQIVIPYEYLPQNKNFDTEQTLNSFIPAKDSIYEFTKKFQEKAKEVFNLEHLDLSNNGVINRLRKLPYSPVKDKVALPLTDEQLTNFSIEHMKQAYILKNIKIRERGLLTRTHGLDTPTLQQRFLTFIKEFKL